MEKSETKQTIEGMMARVKDAKIENAWNMVESTMSSVLESRVAGCVQDMDVALESAQGAICTLMAMVLNKNREIEELKKQGKELIEQSKQYSQWWNDAESKVRKTENKLAVIRQMLDVMQ